MRSHAASYVWGAVGPSGGRSLMIINTDVIFTILSLFIIAKAFTEMCAQSLLIITFQSAHDSINDMYYGKAYLIGLGMIVQSAADITDRMYVYGEYYDNLASDVMLILQL
jgi:hypothetical protein